MITRNVFKSLEISLQPWGCKVDFIKINTNVGFHDKTRLKSENKKMELAIPLDRVDVYLSFSERIIHLPHVYQKLCLIEFWI